MRRNGAWSWREKPRHGDGDDLPPTGDEAREQRKETSMPIVWLGLGLAIMVVFAIILWMRFGVPHLAANAAAPPQSATNPPAKVSP
jgi:hypothetical protein